MENKKLTAPDMDTVNTILKYTLSFFVTVLVTNIICLLTDGSVWFAGAFSLSAGLLSLMVCHCASSDGTLKVKHYSVWLSALLSFLAIAICYTALGVYPFGEKSVMIIDMHHQYSAFFSLMREKILSLESLSYSDSVGMGGGLLPLIAYYLCSPFNLVALLLPRDNLTEAIALIEVLKITAAGAAFAAFCKGVFQKEDYSSVAASVAYALSAYFIAYSWNVMWLDCLVLLPIMIYGLDKVMKGENPLLYCISLGLAITTNYYIGYMLCLFAVMWFVMRLLTEYSGLSLTDGLKKAARFCWTSLVGGMLSMWILVPTALSLRETSGAEDEFARSVTNNFDFFDLFSRMLYHAAPTERGDNLPNIYCSVLAVLLVAVFCLCRSIPVKKRIGFMGLLGVLVICLSNNWLNFAFHGFHFPNDLPYRNSFLISFVVLTMAVQALEHLDDIDNAVLLKAFAIVTAMLVLAEKLSDDQADYAVVWYSLAFLLGYTVILALKTTGKAKTVLASALLASLVFVEVSTNAVSLIHQLDENEVFTKRADFVDDYKVNKAAVTLVEGINEDGSRMEILPRKTCNDDAMYDYSGLSVFASSNAKANTTLMGKLGFAINGVNSYIYHSYVPLIDSILNLKYIAFNHDIGTHAQLVYLDNVTDGEGHYRYLYENTLALAKGFVVDKDIIYWGTNSQSKYENPFEMQNKFIEYAAGCQPVYQMLTPIVERQDNMETTFTDSYFFAESYGDAGSFTALKVVENEAQTYVYVDCRAASAITVMVGDSSWSVTPYEPYVIDLGRLAQGTEIRVEVDADATCSGNVFIAAMDNARLNDAISALGNHQLEITRQKDGFLKGSITADEDSVLFTSIPYNDGWNVKIDGKQAEVVRIGDALLGVYLTAGTHTITMQYHTGGFPLGITLTLLGMVLLALWGTRRKTVYPALKEFVPVLYASISEVRPAPTTSAPAASDDDDMPMDEAVEDVTEIEDEQVDEISDSE